MDSELLARLHRLPDVRLFGPVNDALLTTFLAAFGQACLNGDDPIVELMTDGGHRGLRVPDLGRGPGGGGVVRGEARSFSARPPCSPPE